MLSVHKKAYEEIAAGGVTNAGCGYATLVLQSLTASYSGTKILGRNK